MPLEQTFYFFVDTELHLVHTTKTCSEAKTADKYNYLQSVAIKTVEDAAKLDETAKPCPRCLGRERGKRKTLRNYTPPPGFRG